MNCQLAPLKKLCSQKPLGIIQRDHFNGPHVIKPENFCFVDVGVNNLSIRQNVRFSADSLEAMRRIVLWGRHNSPEKPVSMITGILRFFRKASRATTGSRAAVTVP
jgi:hypothetical protein